MHTHLDRACEQSTAKEIKQAFKEYHIFITPVTAFSFMSAPLNPLCIELLLYDY